MPSEEYPLLRALLADYWDMVAGLSLPPGDEIGEVLDLIGDAVQSLIDGRTAHSFECGLEDDDEDDE